MTIEAVHFLNEYSVRGLNHRVLILTPAALTDQWREGMETKFALPFAVLRSLRDWGRKPFVIASLDTPKREPHRRAAPARPRGLIVVGEAHRLQNPLSPDLAFAARPSQKC